MEGSITVSGTGRFFDELGCTVTMSLVCVGFCFFLFLFLTTGVGAVDGFPLEAKMSSISMAEAS